MSFADHKITEFTHRITDLPDQPTLSPQELKARFDSSPEELRKAVNGICDEGERLSARVEGIVTDTFGDTIDREMLSHELAAELDGKAEQTALDAAVDTLKAADTAETTAREALAKTVAQKCEVYFGSYKGDGNTIQDIALGFTPQAIVIMRLDGATCMQFDCNGGIAMPDLPCVYDGHPAIEVIADGFRVYFTKLSSSYYVRTNESNRMFYYFAFK